MTNLTLEYDQEPEARQDLTYLWDELKLTGEAVLRPKGSRWYLEISAERDLALDEVEKLKGKVV